MESILGANPIGFHGNAIAQPAALAGNGFWLAKVKLLDVILHGYWGMDEHPLHARLLHTEPLVIA